MRPLDNAAWGFETSCFVCEPTNDRGLGIRFFFDEDQSRVVADFSLGAEFSGAPNYVHGGILLAILDEAMAWATIAIAHAFAVTQETTTSFHQPVQVGAPHRVEARIAGEDGRRIDVEAVIVDADGSTSAKSAATFKTLSAEQGRAALGTDVVERDAGYLRG